MFNFDELFGELRRGTAVFLGLLCLLAFVANTLLLLLKRGGSELARCPKCGRMIICPHCSEDKTPPS